MFDGTHIWASRSSANNTVLKPRVSGSGVGLDPTTEQLRAVCSALDRLRRLVGVQLALGVLLFVRLAVINALVNWFGLGPLAAFLVALASVTPVSHLLGSRLTWRGVRS